MKLSSICLSALLLLLTLTPGCVGGDEEADTDLIPAFSVVADDEMTYSSENLLGTPYILHLMVPRKDERYLLRDPSLRRES